MLKIDQVLVPGCGQLNYFQMVEADDVESDTINDTFNTIGKTLDKIHTGLNSWTKSHSGIVRVCGKTGRMN